METDGDEDNLPAISSVDLFETLKARYAKSPAPQHRHLVATAAAMRAILQEESLPLIPPAYFAAAISTVQNTAAGGGSTDATAISALVSFLSIVLAVIPGQALPAEKAAEATEVLITLLRSSAEVLPASTLGSLVKTVGALVKLCNLDEWGSVKLPLETFISFSIDKRPKVRKVAQMSMEEFFKSLQSSKVLKKASKVVLNLFEGFMPMAVELAAITPIDDSNAQTLSKDEHVEVLHMLNALKLVVPFLSEKVQCKLLSHTTKLLGFHYSPITRHILNALEVLIASFRAEVIVDVEELLGSLVSYVSSSGKNQMETVLCASNLLKCVMSKLYAVEPSLWVKHFPHVFGAIAGHLNCGTETAKQMSDILVAMIKNTDGNVISVAATQAASGGPRSWPEWYAVESICTMMENILDVANNNSEEYTLAVISHLFLRLGTSSYSFMKGILLKLSEREMLAREGRPGVNHHLHDCIGSAIVAMGPQKILMLMPITFHPDELNCSNAWLIPLLKRYISGASLKYFMEHIVPLANSIQQACGKVKKSHLLQKLQSCYHGLWDLLPAFCRYPIDISQSFEPLARLLVTVLKERPIMKVTIATSLKELVNLNTSILQGNVAESCAIPFYYSEEVASRNIKTLAVNSKNLLQALRDVLFDSPPEERVYLKEAIGCLASITDSSKVKGLLISSLKKYYAEDVIAEPEKLASSVDVDCGQETSKETKDATKRCIILEFASSLIEGADEALVNKLFDLIKSALQAADGVGQVEAYHALSKIFQEHPWFYSSRFDKLMTLLLGLKKNDAIMSLKSRLSCFRFLLVHLLKSKDEDMSEKAFLILNEIILIVKDSKKEARGAAYDILLVIVNDLKSSKHEDSEKCVQRLFSMILGYLSGSSPHIMSGAVSALSLLIYNNPSLCFAVPDLMSSVFMLLQSKALEVIKAVLGFMKVLVSCLQMDDLRKVLNDVVNGVLPWSDVSKNHIRAKVRIILEILIRKCSLEAVELVAPKKYRGFIRTVVEERRSNIKSGREGTSEVTAKPTELSEKRGNKRKHEQLATNMEEKDSECSNTVKNDKKWNKSKTNTSNGYKGRKAVPSREMSESKKTVRGHIKRTNGGKRKEDRNKDGGKWHVNAGRRSGLSAKPRRKPPKRSKPN